MSEIEKKLTDAIARAKENPAKKKGGKSLAWCIYEQYEEICSAINVGSTYKQIADEMGVDYSYFINAMRRARKKREQVMLKSENNKVDKDLTTATPAGETPKSSDGKREMPRKIIGKSAKYFNN